MLQFKLLNLRRPRNCQAGFGLPPSLEVPSLNERSPIFAVGIAAGGNSCFTAVMPALTQHCHKCGWEWTFQRPPGRSETCLRCQADLKVCLNCAHYDPKVAYQCRERRAEEVAEKAAANFCEYFEMARRELVPKSEDSRETKARDALRKLLGD